MNTIETNRTFFGDCRRTLRELVERDVRVQCCVTSPPYFGLRDYDHPDQIGLESCPEDYIAQMVNVFRHVHALLADDGVLWLNLGDSYSGSRCGSETGSHLEGSRHSQNAAKAAKRLQRALARSGGGGATSLARRKSIHAIPWRVALALQADGCADHRAVQVLDQAICDIQDAYEDHPPPDRVVAVLERLRAEYQEAKGVSWHLRQDIIWNKSNAMPESVTDRCTKAHEYLFILTKQPRYYWDKSAMREPAAPSSKVRRAQDVESQHGSSRAGGRPDRPMKAVGGPRSARDNFKRQHAHEALVPGCQVLQKRLERKESAYDLDSRNRRSVWTVPTARYDGAHFATFPEELIEPCILATSRPNDIVLDCFIGSGTTGKVAQALGRRWIGCELNREYEPQQRARTAQGGLVGV